MNGQVPQFLNYCAITYPKLNVPPIYSSWKYDTWILELVFTHHASSRIVLPPINNHVYFIMSYLRLQTPLTFKNENGKYTKSWT
jgi:hypothetical protein